VRRLPIFTPVCPDRPLDISEYFFSVNLCVLFCQTAAEVSDKIAKLFGRNYVINGSIRYFIRLKGGGGGGGGGL